MQTANPEFAELSRQLRAQRPSSREPAPDLWARIQGSHVRRVRRRRFAQVTSAAMLVVGAIVLSLGGGFAPRSAAPSEMDWQARAQVLELQLRSMHVSLDGSAATADAEADLAGVDRALQAAYDRSADAQQLGPLWKQRTELLNALVTARQQSLAISRI